MIRRLRENGLPINCREIVDFIILSFLNLLQVANDLPTAMGVSFQIV